MLQFTNEILVPPAWDSNNISNAQHIILSGTFFAAWQESVESIFGTQESIIMKTSAKPSLMILCGFILGYIGVFLPMARIQYQVVVNTSQSNTTAPKTITREGFAWLSGDKYGTEALPCVFATVEHLPGSLYTGLLLFWQMIGRALSIAPLCLGVAYAIRRKMPLSKFSLLAVILMLGPVAILLVFGSDSEPICNRNDVYEILSFTPYWPAVLIWITGILLGAWAIRSMNGPNANTVAAN